jgi:hypothetical protein
LRVRPPASLARMRDRGFPAIAQDRTANCRSGVALAGYEEAHIRGRAQSLALRDLFAIFRKISESYRYSRAVLGLREFRRTHASEFPRQVHHDAGNVIVEGQPPSYSVISSKFVRNTHCGPCLLSELVRHNRLEAPRYKLFLEPLRLCHLCRREVHHDSPPSH